MIKDIQALGESRLQLTRRQIYLHSNSLELTPSERTYLYISRSGELLALNRLESTSKFKPQDVHSEHLLIYCEALRKASRRL